MSYCRCSGDDSNVYVLGTGEGIEIHVQCSEQIDKNKKFDPDDMEEYWKNWQDFPHALAGEYYFYLTKQMALTKLLYLREQGLLVPERALSRLRNKIKEES